MLQSEAGSMRAIPLFAFLLLAACNTTPGPVSTAAETVSVKAPPVTKACGEGEFVLKQMRIVCLGQPDSFSALRRSADPVW